MTAAAVVRPRWRRFGRADCCAKGAFPVNTKNGLLSLAAALVWCAAAFSFADDDAKQAAADEAREQDVSLDDTPAPVRAAVKKAVGRNAIGKLVKVVEDGK